jgi:hypothetical protein
MPGKWEVQVGLPKSIVTPESVMQVIVALLISQV